MLLRVKIYKEVAGAGSQSAWSNTYTINTSDTDATGTDAAAQMQRIVAREQMVHLSNTLFTRAVVSTLAKGDSGPTSFKTYPLGVTGNVVVPGLEETNALPLENVLVIGLGSAGGRLARMNYRNCLAAGMWEYEAGGARLRNNEQLEKENWANLFTAETNTDDLNLVIPTAGTSGDSRAVVSIKILGISTRDKRARRKKKAQPDSTSGVVDFLKNNALELAFGLGALILTRGKVGKEAIAQAAPAISTPVSAMKQTIEEIEEILRKATQIDP